MLNWRYEQHTMGACNDMINITMYVIAAILRMPAPAIFQVQLSKEEVEELLSQTKKDLK